MCVVPQSKLLHKIGIIMCDRLLWLYKTHLLFVLYDNKTSSGHVDCYYGMTVYETAIIILAT